MTHEDTKKMSLSKCAEGSHEYNHGCMTFRGVRSTIGLQYFSLPRERVYLAMIPHSDVVQVMV